MELPILNIKSGPNGSILIVSISDTYVYSFKDIDIKELKEILASPEDTSMLFMRIQMKFNVTLRAPTMEEIIKYHTQRLSPIGQYRNFTQTKHVALH